MIKETLVLAALAVSSPAVVDGDTVRIAGCAIVQHRPANRGRRESYPLPLAHEGQDTRNGLIFS